MWRFIEHPVMRPSLWTWAQLDPNGDCVRRSPKTFMTYRKAFRSAMDHGFRPRLEPSEIVAARVRREPPRRLQDQPPLTGSRPEASRGGV